MDELKHFITENGIVGTTSGVIIAMSTKDLIMSLVSDIVYPVIETVVLLFYGGVHVRIKYDYKNFLKLFITWVITLVITYYFIKTTFQYLLGVEFRKERIE